MNANQINARFAKDGLSVRIASGPGYYYWLNDKQELVEAESVYVNRASQLSETTWVELAREVEAGGAL